MQETTDMNNSVSLCYQCAKCSAGCPLAAGMDLLPHQVVKLVQLGLEHEVLRSSTIWLCAGCHTCAVRCPMDIDLPQVMDSLVEQAIARRVPAAQRHIAVFHAAFLSEVKKRGRVNELRQLIQYKLSSRDLYSDLGLGLQMLARRRLALDAERVDKLSQVRALFKQFPPSDSSPFLFRETPVPPSPLGKGVRGLGSDEEG